MLMVLSASINLKLNFLEGKESFGCMDFWLSMISWKVVRYQPGLEHYTHLHRHAPESQEHNGEEPGLSLPTFPGALWPI